MSSMRLLQSENKKNLKERRITTLLRRMSKNGKILLRRIEKHLIETSQKKTKRNLECII
jgi:hypothetical protein